MRVDFSKMEGAGNDFILVDNRQAIVPDGDKVRLATEYCRRSFGIGADGMIFVQNDPEYDFSWDFYNADGSFAEMCGNGARCVARFANAIGAAGNTMTFRSLAGPISAELTERGAKVRMPDAVLPDDFAMVSITDDFVQVWSVNTGVPHAVVKVRDLDKVDVTSLGRILRYHRHFGPGGTNVNFFAPLKDGGLAVRTYERGVEGETLACGTGSVATSLVAARFHGQTSPVTVKTRGGGELVIHFRIEGDRAVDIFLEGGAREVFTGSFQT